MSETKLGRPPGGDNLKTTNYMVTTRFREWLNAERKRRYVTTAGLLNELALTYILSHPEAAAWPEEETP